jgi:hypothetical protein
MRITIRALDNDGLGVGNRSRASSSVCSPAQRSYSNTRRRQICGQFSCNHSHARKRRTPGTCRAKGGRSKSADLLIEMLGGERLREIQQDVIFSRPQRSMRFRTLLGEKVTDLRNTSLAEQSRTICCVSRRLPDQRSRSTEKSEVRACMALGISSFAKLFLLRYFGGALPSDRSRKSRREGANKSVDSCAIGHQRRPRFSELGDGRDSTSLD